MTKMLAIATIVAGYASVGVAQSPRPYSGGYGHYYYPSIPWAYDFTVYPAVRLC
jgi:hypothetical protein